MSDLEGDHAMEMLQKILCPTDFSDNSMSSARYAVRLARQVGAAVEFLHVHHVPLHKSDAQAPQSLDDLRPALREELERSLRDVVAELGLEAEGLQVTTSLAVGVPHEVVAEWAERHGADLVVISSHGRSGLARVVLGSIPERLVRECKVPVLIVRPSGA